VHSRTYSSTVAVFKKFFGYNISSSLQVTVSNPAEVAKTRLQLQGELVKDGGKRVYKNTLDVWAKTWRNEGIRGVQRGLPPAVSNVFYLS
jgi:solute carrier family 25 protein 34/35